MATKKEYYEFLDALQLSGETNMVESVPYVQMKFFLSGKEAREVVLDWMHTYDERLENGEISDRVLVVNKETTMTFSYEDEE